MRVACRQGCGTVLERTRVHKAGALCNACRMRAKKRGRKAAANKALSRAQNPARRVCDVDGCHRRHEALGLCSAHYRQHRRGTLGGDAVTDWLTLAREAIAAENLRDAIPG